jgi:hypothetical protein
MYNYSINSVINDPKNTYTVTPGQYLDQRVQLWITTPQGEVLIRKFNQKAETLETKDLIIESTDVISAIRQVENTANILCSKENLLGAYSLESKAEHLTVNGYILNVKLDPFHKEIIEDNFKGKFIDYKELASMFSGFKVDMNFKEALYNLMSILDQRHTFRPSA